MESSDRLKKQVQKLALQCDETLPADSRSSCHRRNSYQEQFPIGVSKVAHATVPAESGCTLRARATFLILFWCPRFTGPFLDVRAHQSPHNLRGRGVLFGTQPFEELFLTRVDQDRQACGAFFDGQGKSPK
jgi:hypothetical protein